MRRSFGLAAYMAIARRAAQVPPPPRIARPDGPLIWGHATDAVRAAALVQIAARLSRQRPGAHMLLTAAAGVEVPGRLGPQVIPQPVPDETVAAAEAFLGYWAPDLCLWTGGDLRPALVTCSAQFGVPLFLVDADDARLARPSRRWLPDVTRAVLGRFRAVMARSDGAARALRRAGLPEDRITVTGPLRDGAFALSYNESDHEELSGLLRGRPLWLAAMLQPEELDTVMAAQREIGRMAHRSLLIVVPDDPAQGPGIRDRLNQQGLRTAVWSEGQMPEETTQVLLADTHGELGLWYQLAPITLMGSSLTPGGGRDPNEPAAHGSAILHGPNVGRYLARYTRYTEEDAARIVRDRATLATAVQQLFAPDRAAAMAHAAWDVASQGAGVMDRILDLVEATLDADGEA